MRGSSGAGENTIKRKLYKFTCSGRSHSQYKWGVMHSEHFLLSYYPIISTGLSLEVSGTWRGWNVRFESSCSSSLGELPLCQLLYISHLYNLNFTLSPTVFFWFSKSTLFIIIKMRSLILLTRYACNPFQPSQLLRKLKVSHHSCFPDGPCVVPSSKGAYSWDMFYEFVFSIILPSVLLENVGHLSKPLLIIHMWFL